MSNRTFFHGFLAASLTLILVGCPGGDVTGSNSPSPSSDPAGGDDATPGAVAGLGLALSLAAMPANSWQASSPMGQPRGGLSASAINGKIVVLGGDSDQTVETYDPRSEAWSLVKVKTDEGMGRSFGAAMAVGGLVFYAGGTTNWDSSLLEVFNPETSTWLSYQAIYYLPAGVMALAGTALNDSIVLLGGRNVSGLRARVDAYDVVRNEWYRPGDLPEARAGHAAATLNGRIYVAGGYTDLSGIATDSLRVMTPDGEWLDELPGGEPPAAMLTARHSFAMAALGGKLYVAGGIDADGNVLSSVEEYDPAANRWTAKAPMPSARVHLAMTALGDRLYALGGFDADRRPVRTTEVFRP